MGKKKKGKGTDTKAKKKTCSARATIKRGTGKVRINKRFIETVQPRYLRMFISEPLVIAGETAQKVDISVNAKGGGFMSQAVASRGAIAKALVDFSRNKELKGKMLKYDRMLLVDDSRKREPKKPLGRGARAKKQKSKR